MLLTLITAALAGPAQCMADAEALFTSWPVRADLVAPEAPESAYEAPGVSQAVDWFVDWIPTGLQIEVELSRSLEEQLLYAIDCTEGSHPAWSAMASGLLAQCVSGGHCG